MDYGGERKICARVDKNSGKEREGLNAGWAGWGYPVFYALCVFVFGAVAGVFKGLYVENIVIRQ